MKNIHLDRQTVVSILGAVGLLAAPPPTGPVTFPREGSTGTITRPAKIVREGGPLDPATPLVVQISRWDRLKDMLGVMTAGAVDPDDVGRASGPGVASQRVPADR